VKDDPKEYYSTKIDNDVFIYSVGALLLYQRYKDKAESSPIFSFYLKITIFSLIEIFLLFLFALFSVKTRFTFFAKPLVGSYILPSIFVLNAILLIFLIFIGPKEIYNKYLDSLIWTRRNGYIFYYLGAVIVLLIALLIISELTSKNKFLSRFGKYAAYLVFAAITAFIFQPSFVTCYPPFTLGGWRRKESYPKYLELLIKYRDSKVISLETFDKIKQALDLELAKDEEEENRRRNPLH
jgi:hypothetical protein